jgi:transposase
MSKEVAMNNIQTKRPNPKLTLELKQDAAKLVHEQGYTHPQAAGCLGISLSAIGRWPRAERAPAAASATRKATLNPTGHSELARLRRENGQLRMGRETLLVPFGKKGRGLPVVFAQDRPCQGSRTKCGVIREQQKAHPVTVSCRVVERWVPVPFMRGQRCQETPVKLGKEQRLHPGGIKGQGQAAKRWA